jgi:hypothetical protein
MFNKFNCKIGDPRKSAHYQQNGKPSLDSPAEVKKGFIRAVKIINAVANSEV